MGRDVDGSTMGKMMILRKEKNYLLQYIIVLRGCARSIYTPLNTVSSSSRCIILRCAVSVAPQINLSVPSRAAARRPRAGVYRAVQ